jgi:hypothetical protein
MRYQVDARMITTSLYTGDALFIFVYLAKSFSFSKYFTKIVNGFLRCIFTEIQPRLNTDQDDRKRKTRNHILRSGPDFDDAHETIVKKEAAMIISDEQVQQMVTYEKFVFEIELKSDK